MKGKPTRCQGIHGGYALLGVTVIVMMAWATCVSFVWYMNRQITWSGRRYRDTAAFQLAEAGIQMALAALESTAPDGTPGKHWRPSGFVRRATVGDLVGEFVLRVDEQPGGLLLIMSEGRVGPAYRRVRAQVLLVPSALQVALYGAAVIQLESSSSITVMTSRSREAPGTAWTHIGVGRELRFVNVESTMVNDRFGVGSSVQADDWISGRPVTGATLEEARLMLAGDAALAIGREGFPVNIQQLRGLGLRIYQPLYRARQFPNLPVVNGRYFRGLAAANEANADTNRAAGFRTHSRALQEKRHSLYESVEFADLVRYSEMEGKALRLQGLVYVSGGVDLPAGVRLIIDGGALIAESTVQVNQTAELSILQTLSGAVLPGLVVHGGGALMVGPNASVRVTGVIVVEGTLDIGPGSLVDVVGTVLGGDPMMSVRNAGGQLMVQYDPRILGTLGLQARPGEPIAAWILRWEQLD